MDHDEYTPQPLSSHFPITDLSDDARRFALRTVPQTRASNDETLPADLPVSTGTGPWWVAVTQIGLERRCAADLSDRGFEAWFPERLVQYRTKHMKVPAQRWYPLLAGYVFIRPTGEVPTWRWERPRDDDGRGCIRTRVGTERRDAHWCETEGADGFRRLLRNASRPVAVGAPVLDVFRRHLDDVANTPVSMQVWRRNDVGRICKGQFAQFNAEVASDEVRGVVQVLVHIFGRQTPLSLPVEHLERLA